MPIKLNRNVICDISSSELAALNEKLGKEAVAEHEILSLRERMLKQIETVKEQRALEDWVTNDAKMLTLKDRVTKIAPRREPVLITGPTGVGKGMLARAINSPGRPFIVATCGGLPRELVSSLFFGYKKGSFTGAAPIDRNGYLAAAEDGTIFLDEIGDLPMEVQPVLLHAIQEREVYPVGDNIPKRIECRFVSATNYDLEERIRAGLFRRDLYARLSTFHLKITGLSERPGDVDLIARKIGYKGPLPFPDSVLERIAHENVRAIEAAIARYEAYGEYD